MTAGPKSAKLGAKCIVLIMVATDPASDWVSSFAVLPIPRSHCPSQMLLKITYSLDVISLGCHWSSPPVVTDEPFGRRPNSVKVGGMDSSAGRVATTLEWF